MMIDTSSPEIAKLCTQGRRYALTLGVLPFLFLTVMVAITEYFNRYSPPHTLPQQEQNDYLWLCFVWLGVSLWCCVKVGRIFRRFNTLNAARGPL